MKLTCLDGSLKSNFVLYSFSLQFRNAPNLLRHDHALLVRCFSHNAQPTTGKKNECLYCVIYICVYVFQVFLCISRASNVCVAVINMLCSDLMAARSREYGVVVALR